MGDRMECGGAGRENRHSRMGIASLMLAVLAIIAIVLFFVISVSVASSEIGNDPQSFDPNSIDESSPLASTFALLGLGLIGSVLLTVGLRARGGRSYTTSPQKALCNPRDDP